MQNVKLKKIENKNAITEFKNDLNDNKNGIGDLKSDDDTSIENKLNFKPIITTTRVTLKKRNKKLKDYRMILMKPKRNLRSTKTDIG
jgi:hypothetical protein